MRLVNVQAVNTLTKEAYRFSFGDIDESAKPVAKNGAVLVKILKDIFCGEKFGGFDISADFIENDMVYNLARKVSEGRRVLLQLNGQKLSEAAAGGEVEIFLRTVLGGDAAEIIEKSFLTAEEFEKFAAKPDFGAFPKIESALEEKHEGLEAKLQDIPAVSRTDIEKAQREIALRQDVVKKIKERYSSLQERLAQSATYGLTNELKQSRDHLKELEEKKSLIEEKRACLKEYGDVKEFIPKIRILSRLKEQTTDLISQCTESKKELDWYESEFSSVTNQLDEKQKALYKTIAKRVGLQAIEAQTARAADLTEKNTKLGEQANGLSAQLESLMSQKIALKNSLGSIDEAIGEIKSTMDEFAEPDKNFADLLESVRINAKTDELENQVEKYRAEIIVKESQIAEREKLLSTQTKQLRNIMDVDTAVSPYKAREAIMSVIDYKIEKLSAINASLKEKMRNLQRSKENANYQLAGIAQSQETMEKELEKLRKTKGEEFKRQVLINSQKIYQDATAVYAVENDLDDDELKSLENLLKARAEEKQRVSESVARITGAVDEILRHIDINQSDISELNEQKQNIITQYNRLIHENTNEAVSNYLRAIETDKGTNYLLEINSDSVRTETEIKELRKTVDNIRLRLGDAETRLKQLKDARSIIDGDIGTMESMLHINEQTKNELTDVAIRLTSVYNKHKTTLSRIDELDLKIARIQELILEINKTVKLNEREIEHSARQAEKFAGGNVESVLGEAKFEERELNAEITMLLGSKSTIESQFVDKKVAYGQLNWLKENKENELRAFRESLKTDFAANNIDDEFLAKIEEFSDENITALRQDVEGYDDEIAEIKERVVNLVKMLAQTAPVDRELTGGIEQAKTELNAAQRDLAAAEDSHKKLVSAVAAATTVKENLEKLSRAAPREAADFLKRANYYLQDVSEYRLRYDGGLAFVLDNEKQDAAKIEKQDKLAAFLAMKMAYPTNTRARAEFIILGDGMAKERYREVYANMIDLTFVTTSRYTKPKEAIE